MMSSGGHSPWSFPIWVYSVKRNQFASFSDMINGDLDDKVPVSVDLETAFDRLPAPSK